MTAIQAITRPIINSGLKSGLKTKAIALAAAAAMIPAIANAQTKTETVTTTSKTEAYAPKKKTNETHIQTYYMTPNFHNSNAYNVSGNQMGIKVGADGNYNGTNKTSSVGPYINVAGKTAGRVNGVFDVDAKAGFDLPSTEGKIMNLGAYGAAGVGVDIVKQLKNRFSADLAGEAFINSDVNKTSSSTITNTSGYNIENQTTTPNVNNPNYDIQSQTTTHRFNGNHGYGGRFRLTGQHGIGKNVRLTESAHVAYGKLNNNNSNYTVVYDGTQPIIYDALNTKGTYARAGANVDVDLGNISIGVYGTYNRTYGTTPLTGEQYTNDSWGGGARVAFRFGN